MNRGLLNIKFNDPESGKSAYHNFKDYLKGDQFINEEFLWDFLTRPNILMKNGVNIVILEFTRIICPTIYGLSNIFDLNRPTYFHNKE